jgi:hypothetical protein
LKCLSEHGIEQFKPQYASMAKKNLSKLFGKGSSFFGPKNQQKNISQSDFVSPHPSATPLLLEYSTSAVPMHADD